MTNEAVEKIEVGNQTIRIKYYPRNAYPYDPTPSGWIVKHWEEVGSHSLKIHLYEPATNTLHCYLLDLDRNPLRFSPRGETMVMTDERNGA